MRWPEKDARVEEDSTRQLQFSKASKSQEVLAMGVHGWLECLTQCDSPKYIHIQSVTCGCVKCFLYTTVALSVW